MNTTGEGHNHGRLLLKKRFSPNLKFLLCEIPMFYKKEPHGFVEGRRGTGGRSKRKEKGVVALEGEETRQQWQ